MSTIMQAGPTTHMEDIAQEHPVDAAAREFLMFCPSASSDSDVMNAIHALYYLPKEYKLVLMKDAALVDGRKMTEGNEQIADRILFETEARVPGETPSFSYADAVICSDTSDLPRMQAPYIVPSVSLTEGLRGSGSTITVPADSPEALASAAMLIARGTYVG